MVHYRPVAKLETDKPFSTFTHKDIPMKFNTTYTLNSGATVETKARKMNGNEKAGLSVTVYSEGRSIEVIIPRAGAEERGVRGQIETSLYASVKKRLDGFNKWMASPIKVSPHLSKEDRELSIKEMQEEKDNAVFIEVEDGREQSLLFIIGHLKTGIQTKYEIDHVHNQEIDR